MWVICLYAYRWRTPAHEYLNLCATMRHLDGAWLVWIIYILCELCGLSSVYVGNMSVCHTDGARRSMNI